MQKYECIEYNGEKYEYLGNGPTATGAHNGWAMCDTIYFKCISCGYLMSGGSSEYDTCSCGKMHKDVDAGRFGRSDGGDMSVEVFQKAVEINEITPADTFSYKTVTYQPRNNPANLHYFREADMSLFKRKKYEYPLLEDFLYHAIFVPPNEKPFPRDEIYKPEIFMYIDGFGNKHGDCGVIAKRDGEVIGAAWTRIIPAFGHIDNSTPELATSVTPTARKRGIGTRMLTHLFELLRNRGFAQTSLSVQKENPATRLYQRLGYEILRENDEDWIMLRGL